MTQKARALVHLGFQAGTALSCITPVLGLAVFWLLPFKPAVTIYAVITGLAYALLKWIELRRLSLQLDEILKGRYDAGPSKEKISGGVKWLR